MLNIITNTSSMMASRALNENQLALAQSFQRLSTGLRLNSAKDDAASLAISNRLTSQYRGLNQAVRNANDTTSLLQTAESGIIEQQGMLQRLRELAIQAGSETNTTADRSAIQTEANALMSEIDRVATQTSYNGRNLLDGSISNLSFQIGAFANQTVAVTIGSTRNYTLGSVFTFTTNSVGSAADATVTDLTLNTVAIRAPVAADDPFSPTANAQRSAIAKAAAINASSTDHGVTATVGATVEAGNAAIITSKSAAGAFEINGVAVGAFTSITNDANSALRNAINALTSQTGVVATLDTASRLVLTATDGRNIELSTAITAAGGVTAGVYTGTLDLKSESGQIVVAGGDSAEYGLTNASVGTQVTLNASNLDYGSQSTANDALGVIDDAISQLNARQANIGALLNRMETAVSSLSAAAENIAAARGQIRDADFAAETAAFSKNQILQQASASMLAQANVQGQLALQLLG